MLYSFVWQVGFFHFLPLSALAATLWFHMCFASAENLWRYVNTATKHGGEQFTLNYALQDLGVRWKKTTTVKNICNVKSGWRSYGPLNCVVFSQKDVCRGCCGNAQKHNYYILHPLSDKNHPEKKFRVLKYISSWFLSDSWKKLTSLTSEGSSWLRSVSTLNDGWTIMI